MKTCLLIATIGMVSGLKVQNGQGGKKSKNLRAGSSAPDADASVLKPLEFDQRLLICNAYPSKSPIAVQKNGLEVLADSSHALGFRECRYIQSHVKPRDKLDLHLEDVDVHGTFEVGDLPDSDAVLLLVLGKHKGSTMLSFSSYAFAATSTSSEAQIAVIDAFHGNSSSPHLKMEDHIEGKQKQSVSRRVEQLNFNRVYAIDEGVYDTSVAEGFDEAAGKEVAQRTRHTVKFARNKNYVVLRTGDESSGEAESLVVFPEAEFVKSAGCRPIFPVVAILAAVFASLA